MQHSRRASAGLTIGEVIAIVFVLGLLVALVLPMLSRPRYPPRYSARCRSRMHQLFKATRLYLNEYDEHFPLAWHEGSGDGFGQVTYARFLIQMTSDTSIDFRSARDHKEQAKMFEENVAFWSCPKEGLTNDYFSPPAIFRLPAPDEMKKPFSRHTQHAQLTARVPSTRMPFLADAAASTPRPDASDTPPETYAGIPGAFKRDAFTFDGETHDAFYGVARSWSDEWDPASERGSGHERFDFRHNGAINVILLDGHVDSFTRHYADRLIKTYNAWNIDSEGAP